MSEADLVARAAVVREGEARELLLVRPPTQLGGRDALLVEPLDRPRVHELVLALRLVADLRVALRDVDRLDAQGLREAVPGALGAGGGDRLRAAAAPFERRVCDVGESRLGEVRDEAGVRTVV